MSDFIYLLKTVPMHTEENIWTPSQHRNIDMHYAYLQELDDQGILILAGKSTNHDSSAFSLVIIRAESESIARKLMEKDPAIKTGIMKAELYPFQRIVQATDGSE